MTLPEDKELLCAMTVRFLAADAVEKARSGHPGMPMGMAEAAVALWSRFLTFDPERPGWPDRDRFVLSAGHGSTLLYSLLHLAGFGLSLEDLEHFRQWGSKTPGHPEAFHPPGVETTTGPLGQGLATAVGMALAERMLAARFNREGLEVVNHRTFVIAGDGDMMEGVTSEAASLAGHLGLGKLVVLYDSNGITIEGNTSLAFSEDVPARFEAMGWKALRGVDGQDPGAVARALEEALSQESRPVLIEIHTQIGHGAPHLGGTAKVHGAPLGPEELKAAKENLGWPTEPPFFVPPGAADPLREAAARGRKKREDWERRMALWRKEDPAGWASWEEALSGKPPENLEEILPSFPPDPKGMATRAASGKVLEALGRALPFFAGGSADLAPSNKTRMPGAGDLGPGNFGGRNLHFGVREHAMGAVLNGLALHGGIRPFGGTFLVFSDYMRGALRLSAMMKTPVIFVFTHDSIGVGEDGPTHQPVEQLASLRALPGLHVLRPADANETAAAWAYALRRTDGPTALVLSRQALPTLEIPRQVLEEGFPKGAYPVKAHPSPRAILLATGSEVSLALAASALLEEKGIPVQVVSLPCMEAFRDQPPEWREKVLPPSASVVFALEAGVSFGWSEWIRPPGAHLTLDRFGASAPAGVLFEKFGFTPEEVARRVEALLE